jgi:hypothetical protein
MTMDDVWLETVHESERRDGKMNTRVPASKDTDRVTARDTKKRPAASKDNSAKAGRGQGKKPAA